MRRSATERRKTLLQRYVLLSNSIPSVIIIHHYSDQPTSALREDLHALRALF